MRELSDSEIQGIVRLLQPGGRLPEHYKGILFDTKREYELVYSGKEREEDILAETIPVPLQAVKSFGSRNTGTDWTNTLVFGDNLQPMVVLPVDHEEGHLSQASIAVCQVR